MRRLSDSLPAHIRALHGLPAPLEKSIVAAIKVALQTAGYLVAEVSQLGGQGSGTTTGYPDLSVRHPLWPRGCALLLEVKRPNVGRLSPAQTAMHEAGWSRVVRSEEEALTAAATFDLEVRS